VSDTDSTQRTLAFDDERFAALALERGIATGAQIEAARVLQLEEGRAGRAWSLGQLLVRARVLPPDGLVAILRELKGRFWQCPRCLSTLADADVDAGCRVCGVEVERPRHELETITEALTVRPRSWEELVVPLSPKRPKPPVSHLGRFELIETLGSGGMGIVYKAKDPTTGGLVALKVLKASASPNQLARFRREAESIAKLRHPDLVALVDVGLEGGEPWIAMEYVPGETLQDKFLFAPWPTEPDALALIARVARAVHHAHEHGIVHRDLKPGNIIMSPDGPKLTDFGLAKALESDAVDLTRSGVAIGTPLYMSPEQAQGKSELVDARSDVFAMGIMLYLLLVGELPFTGDSHFGIYEKIVHEQPARPRSMRPSVSPGAESVCLIALAKNQEDRFPTALAFAEACEAAIKVAPAPKAPAPAPRPSAPAPEAAAPRKSRRVALVLALILGAGVLAAGAASGPELMASLRAPRSVAPPLRVLSLGAPLAAQGASLAGVSTRSLLLGGRAVAPLEAAPSAVALAVGCLVVSTPRSDTREDVAFLDPESGAVRCVFPVEGRVLALVPFEGEAGELAIVADRGAVRTIASVHGAPRLVEHEVFRDLAREHVLAACARRGGGLVLVAGTRESAVLRSIARGTGSKDLVVDAELPVKAAAAIAALDADRFALLGEDGALSLYVLRDAKLALARPPIAPSAPFGPARGLLVASCRNALVWATESRAPTGEVAFALTFLDKPEGDARTIEVAEAPLDLLLGEEGAYVALEHETRVYR
jgi:hypothetical protein